MGLDRQKYCISIERDGCYTQLVVELHRYELSVAGVDGNASLDRSARHAIGRLLMELVPDKEQCLRVANHTNVAIEINDQHIQPGEVVDGRIPLSIGWSDGQCAIFMPLTEAVMARGCSTLLADRQDLLADDASIENASSELTLLQRARRSPSLETLTHWFESMASIQRYAANTEEFHRHAVRAIVNPGGLDVGMILDRADDGNWSIRCGHKSDSSTRLRFEPALVELVYRRREPLMLGPQRPGVGGQSGAALIAAPVFDADLNVVAVIYGSRHPTERNQRQRMRTLEALWIQLLAEAMTAGYVRLAHEATIARQRVLLEQAFPLEVVRQLSIQSTLELPPCDKEVTLMFADLFDSSSLSHQLPPDLLIELLSEVMDSMTDVIHRHAGVVVDYYGDGLIAMWNAPVEQADHASLACEAGLDIKRLRTAIDGRWSHRLGTSVRIGVGIHTGRATVGNSGSRHRLKYGPRGFAVNVANRIEKATRPLGQSILISDETRRRLNPVATAYRLGKFKLWGIDSPVGLHALFSTDSNGNANSCCIAKHHEVVRLIEDGDYGAATERLESCTGCALDELSLGFLKQQLESMVESREQDRQQDLVLDLTKLE